MQSKGEVCGCSLSHMQAVKGESRIVACAHFFLPSVGSNTQSTRTACHFSRVGLPLKATILVTYLTPRMVPCSANSVSTTPSPPIIMLCLYFGGLLLADARVEEGRAVSVGELCGGFIHT